MSTAAELVERLRSEILDDTIAAVEDDYGWKTSEILAALDWAHGDLAGRLLLIEDSTTVAVCNITIAKSGGVYPRTYTLHPSVLAIERLKYPGVTVPLAQTTVNILDRADSGWEAKEGTPTLFVVNRNKTITFNRQPIADGTVTMTVKRKPLEKFSAADADTEMIGPEFDYDDALLHGAAMKLYLKDDKKTFDPTRSRMWGQEYRDDIDKIIRDQAALSPQIHIMRPEW
jgi:hypothetical protein